MDKAGIKKLINSLAGLKTGLYGKDFLLTWRKSDADINGVMKAAEILQNLYENNISAKVFDGGLGITNFRDNSTRTRFSFVSAASLLGLTLQDLDEEKSQIAHGETVRETANMISFAAETIGIRDDMYVGYGHEYMTEVSDSVEWGYNEGVLAQRPSIINLQCDRDHPTQSMSDMMHLVKEFGGVENLRGKRIAMTWAYSPSYGKPLSVPQSIITLMTRFGMDVALAHPEGYDLIPETLDVARKHAEASGGKFTQTNSMAEAFEGADIVYPKSWAPFNIMERRTNFIKEGGPDMQANLDALEKEGLDINARYKDWECTEELMARTNGGKALYMHCLPADITGVSCDEGEVVASVFERYRKPLYQEAKYKVYVIAAMMLLTRFENPAQILEGLLERGAPRRGL